jgi:uncharacterized SAM-binding protein YcdF (DUF218 family)
LTNTKRKTFDLIVVLGNPAKSDGSPGEAMKQRVLKAVELFHGKQAKYLLFTGAAVYNAYVEADVMKQFACSKGIPETALLTDPEARNTYQNLFNAIEIMAKNHWSSALVVTSPSHVKRTAFVLSHYDIDYRIVASEVSPEQWLSQFLIGQWENYLLTRLALRGYTKFYGLTPEQISGASVR